VVAAYRRALLGVRSAQREGVHRPQPAEVDRRSCAKADSGLAIDSDGGAGWCFRIRRSWAVRAGEPAAHLLVPRVRPGGLLVGDNALYAGEAASPDATGNARQSRRPGGVGAAARRRRPPPRPQAVRPTS